MIVNDLELSNITMFLHNSEELKKDFGGRSDDNLFFSFSFSIDYGFEAISKNISSGHDSDSFCG
jgi:hypothetical protein